MGSRAGIYRSDSHGGNWMVRYRKPEGDAGFELSCDGESGKVPASVVLIDLKGAISMGGLREERDAEKLLAGFKTLPFTWAQLKEAILKFATKLSPDSQTDSGKAAKLRNCDMFGLRNVPDFVACGARPYGKLL